MQYIPKNIYMKMMIWKDIEFESSNGDKFLFIPIPTTYDADAYTYNHITPIFTEKDIDFTISKNENKEEYCLSFFIKIGLNYNIYNKYYSFKEFNLEDEYPDLTYTSTLNSLFPGLNLSKEELMTKIKYFLIENGAVFENSIPYPIKDEYIMGTGICKYPQECYIPDLCKWFEEERKIHKYLIIKIK